MTEDTKRKLEAEENRHKIRVRDFQHYIEMNKSGLNEERKRHAEEMKRLLAEKESGWSDIKVPLCLVTGRGGNSLYSLTTNCDIFTDYCKAKEYAAKIGLFLKMSKWADENNGDGLKIWYLFIIDGVVDFAQRAENVYEPQCIYFSSYKTAEKARENFGEEILKIWVRGEYE